MNSFSSKDHGYLELLIGPMFAGKSTELIRRYHLYSILKKRILSINHSLNRRYQTQHISTHDQLTIESQCIVSKLCDIEQNRVEQSDVILIEEIQFFPDAFEYISKWVDDYGKIIIATGLSGDSSRKPFGDVLRLIPIANTVCKLSALCMQCGDGTPAHFSKRLSAEKQITLIGSADKYEAVCRRHYLE